ncbi:hypothetical protein AMTRI_Chr09g42410 [Amborella trichopoda]
MQNPKPVFLEDWLRNCLPLSHPPLPQPSSARDIDHAWSHLRLSLSNKAFQKEHLNSLETLQLFLSSLHVADPQAKLLLAILSLPIPQELRPRAFQIILRILSLWVRKASNPSLTLLESAVSETQKLLGGGHGGRKGLIPVGILLLGVMASIPNLSERSKVGCLELVCELLQGEHEEIGEQQGMIPEVLAGVGYSLSSLDDGFFFDRILGLLLGLWVVEDGPCVSVPHGLMVLHLIEWLVSGFLQVRKYDNIESICRRIETSQRKSSALGSQFVSVMAASGALRAFNLDKSGNIGIRILLEGVIDLVAGDWVLKTDIISNLDQSLIPKYDKFASLLLQCISIGVSRIDHVSFHPHLFICLALSLLFETFPLLSLYQRITENYKGEFVVFMPDLVRETMASIVFREAGATTRAFCNQYVLAGEEHRLMVENLILDYCQSVYSYHRRIVFMFRERKEMLEALGKIAQDAFLMIVVFLSTASKHKISPSFSNEIQADISVKTLMAFSCMEYFRRVRLAEYTDTIRRTVLCIQENETALTSFINSVPPYDELTNHRGCLCLEGTDYSWSQDDVQTARVFFYLRVLSTCMGHTPVSAFKKSVVPTMFLYMQHPANRVARASHSLFVAFISTEKETDQDQRTQLKERVAFYYMQRTLEAYPAITPMEGLSSGVIALVRHLPPGNPAIFYGIHSLFDKAYELCIESTVQSNNNEENKKEVKELGMELTELILRLMFLVDIQVLPDLLKRLAQFVVQLAAERQIMVLNEIYSQVASSDDVVRKPILVPWLHSVTYLCSPNKKISGIGNSASNSGGELGKMSVCNVGNSSENQTESSSLIHVSRL